MVHHKFVALLLGLVLCAGLRAQAPELKSDHPQRYTVQPGDTLWGIASRFLREPWRWKEIWRSNPEIANPNLIFPGDVIVLRYEAGEPRLGLTNGGRRTVRLSPQVRVSDLEDEIPTIPIGAIRPFLTSPRVFSHLSDVESLPYVVAFSGEHMIGGMGNSIYVINLDDPDKSRFNIVRRGDAYVDPDTHELLGYEAEYVGDATLTREGNPATLLITHTEQEVNIGDRLLPAAEEHIGRTFVPRAPVDEVEGRILGVLDGLEQVGRHQVVALSLGEDDEVEPGDVMAVYEANRLVTPGNRWGIFGQTVELPAERAGLVMVFRSFERVSYALVMEAQRTMGVGDLVVNP
jgi:hypothetical protein